MVLTAYISTSAISSSQRGFFLKNWQLLHKTLMNSGVVRSVVYSTNDQQMWDELQKAGCTLVWDYSAPRQESSVYPRGFHSVLDLGRDVMGKEPIMVVDYGAARINHEHIRQAVKLFETGRFRSVASVTTMRDNPVQLKSYWEVAEFGPVVGIDHTYSKKSKMLISKPFYYDWGFNSCRALGCTTLGEVVQHGDTLLKSSENEARICFDIGQEVSASTYAICLDLARGKPFSFLEEKEGNSLVSGFIPQNGQNAVMRFTNRDGSILAEADFCGAPTLPCVLETGSSKMISYFVLENTLSGYYVKNELLQTRDSLWIQGADQCSLINRSTGEKIVGRQNFPHYIQVDGRFAIGTYETLMTYDKDMRFGKIGGIKLPDDLIRVEEPFDEVLFSMFSKET